MKKLSFTFWIIILILFPSGLFSKSPTIKERYDIDSENSNDDNVDAQAENQDVALHDSFRPRHKYKANGRQTRYSRSDGDNPKEQEKTPQCAVMYKGDEPVGILQPFKESYRFIPISGDPTLVDISPMPVKRKTFMDVPVNPSKLNEDYNQENSENNQFADDRYPSIFAKFKIDSRLDKSISPNWNYKRSMAKRDTDKPDISNEQVSSLKTDLSKMKADNSAVVEEKLKDIIDDMGLLDNYNDKEEAKREVAEDENMEEGTNKINLIKEEHNETRNKRGDKNDRSKFVRDGPESSRNKRDDSNNSLSKQDKEQTTNNTDSVITPTFNSLEGEHAGEIKSIDLFKSNDGTLNKYSENEGISTEFSAGEDMRKKRQFVQKEKKDEKRDATEDYPEDNNSDLDNETELSQYEKRVEREIKDKIQKLKEEVKEEIKLLKSNPKTSTDESESGTRRRKRQIINTLMDEETQDIDPILNDEGRNVEHHVRRKRSINFEDFNLKHSGYDEYLKIAEESTNTIASTANGTNGINERNDKQPLSKKKENDEFSLNILSKILGKISNTTTTQSNNATETSQTPSPTKHKSKTAKHAHEHKGKVSDRLKHNHKSHSPKNSNAKPSHHSHKPKNGSKKVRSMIHDVNCRDSGCPVYKHKHHKNEIKINKRSSESATKIPKSNDKAEIKEKHLEKEILEPKKVNALKPKTTSGEAQKKKNMNNTLNMIRKKKLHPKKNHATINQHKKIAQHSKIEKMAHRRSDKQALTNNKEPTGNNRSNYTAVEERLQKTKTLSPPTVSSTQTSTVQNSVNLVKTNLKRYQNVTSLGSYPHQIASKEKNVKEFVGITPTLENTTTPLSHYRIRSLKQFRENIVDNLKHAAHIRVKREDVDGGEFEIPTEEKMHLKSKRYIRDDLEKRSYQYDEPEFNEERADDGQVYDDQPYTNEDSAQDSGDTPATNVKSTCNCDKSDPSCKCGSQKADLTVPNLKQDYADYLVNPKTVEKKSVNHCNCNKNGKHCKCQNFDESAEYSEYEEDEADSADADNADVLDDFQMGDSERAPRRPRQRRKYDPVDNSGNEGLAEEYDKDDETENSKFMKREVKPRKLEGNQQFQNGEYLVDLHPNIYRLTPVETARNKRDSFKDLVAIHGGGPVTNHLVAIRQRSMLPHSRFRRRVPIDDTREPRQLIDMNDEDLFGALPQGFAGELARYKRVKRGRNEK